MVSYKHQNESRDTRPFVIPHGETFVLDPYDIGNGVPIETVSRMLGHADIGTTQVYARVTPKKLFEDMDKYIEATKDLKLIL